MVTKSNTELIGKQCDCLYYPVWYVIQLQIYSNINNHIYICFAFCVQQRCLSPEQKYSAEGLACHSQDTSSQKFNADEDSSMNG